MVPPIMPTRCACFAFCLLVSTISLAQNVPRSSHVWVINEENNSYESIVGNSQMPYYSQLIQKYALASQLYSDQHSSLPALMWYVAGAEVESDNDTVSCEHSEDNVVRELLKRGYTWKAYEENLPNAGNQSLYAGTTNIYYRRHNPLIDFTDVCPGTGQDIMSVPYTQLATDLANGAIVNYAWITPAGMDDDHDGTLQEADEWLQANVPAILARPEFGPGGDGILFIVWDESLNADDRCSSTVATGCGGRLADLVIGPQVKSGFESTITYRSENVLATVCAAMGLSTCPGAAQSAAPMADVFKSGADSPSNSVVISTPGNGATIVGEVHLMATASEGQAVSQVQVWDNGAKLGVVDSDQVDAFYNLAPGKHTTTVIDLNSSYKNIHQASVTYTVEPLVDGVQIVSPTSNEVFDMTTVHVVAQANESVPISQMQVWDNGVKLGRYSDTAVNQYFTLAPGSHTITVTDLDGNYNILHQSSVFYTVQ
jgi:phosphatidylinositol-3-phosphatase